ncbi:MAG: hypothetical protein IJM87_03950 [Ruminococcus sp.]|nr:hypothetical protein [Ruminococcus sp.]
MEAKLIRLFECQRFAKNAKLASVIEDVAQRYKVRDICYHDLELVTAAGEIIKHEPDRTFS